MMAAPISAEVVAHALTQRLGEIGRRAMLAGGNVIDRESAVPWWRPLKRHMRKREAEAVLGAIGYMLGEEPIPNA